MVLSTILVQEKIQRTKKYLDEIKPYLAFSLHEILHDLGKLRTLERNFQLIVDEVLDINQHFIKELNLSVPDDFESTFSVLAENKILPESFANKIAPVVGLRNRLVHRYEEIDNKIFVQSFKKGYPDFKKYIKYIYQYMEKTTK